MPAGGVRALGFAVGVSAGAVLGLGMPAGADDASLPAPRSARQELPPALQGAWLPLSRSLETTSSVRLSKRRLSWSICGARHAPVDLQSLDPHGPTAVFSLPPGACRLDGVRVSWVRWAREPGRCDATVTLFETAQAFRQNEPLAQGLFQQENCRAEGGGEK